MGNRSDWTPVSLEIVEAVAAGKGIFDLSAGVIVNMAREILHRRTYHTEVPVTDKIRTPADPPKLSAATMEEAANYRWLLKQSWFYFVAALNLSDSRPPRSFHDDIVAARRKKD